MSSPDNSHRLGEAQFKQLVCDCGSRQFTPRLIVKLAYNALVPRELRITKGEKYECIDCGSLVQYDAEHKQWGTVKTSRRLVN